MGGVGTDFEHSPAQELRIDGPARCISGGTFARNLAVIESEDTGKRLVTMPPEGNASGGERSLLAFRGGAYRAEAPPTLMLLYFCFIDAIRFR